MVASIRKYDIVEADLGQNIGAEQCGKRPVLIVQNNLGNKYSPTTLIIPFSKVTKKENQSTHTIIKKSDETGLKLDSTLLAEQIRVISNQRIIRKIGSIKKEEEKREITRIIMASFGE